jgi:5,10-methylenetetrahydromethanopterin reductase
MESSASPIRFGVTLQGVEPPRVFQQQVRDIEESGFTHLWITDSSLHARYVYSYLTLAALNSEQLLLGTGVTHPFTRHPAMNVNAIATLDEISEGRAILGIGAGDSPTVELGFAPAKVQIVREMIEVARRLMAGETLDYEGPAFRIKHGHLHYKFRDRVPIYMACSGPRMLELAGELADGVIVQCGLFPEAIEFAREHVARGAARAERSREEVDFWVMMCGAISNDRSVAMNRSRTMAAWFAQMAPHMCEVAGVDRATVEKIQAAYSGGEFHQAQAAAALTPDTMVEYFTLGGTPEDARARLERLIACGVKGFNYMPTGAGRPESLGLFAGEVMRPLRTEKALADG